MTTTGTACCAGAAMAAVLFADDTAVVSLREGEGDSERAVLYVDELVFVTVGTDEAEVAALKVTVLLSTNDPAANGDDTNDADVVDVDNGNSVGIGV